jgi:large subunit ribosomal protein L6
MSRIGNAIIEIPSGVEFNFDSKASIVTVKGPKGELTQEIKGGLDVKVEDGNIIVSRPNEEKISKSLHGLYRTLINNMVIGVSQGHKTAQELVGVGYKCSNQGNLLEMSLGYSHKIMMAIPTEVKVETVTEKGKNPTILLESMDKQLVGQVAAKIRSLRKPEPYKGKGIRFAGEQVRRKAGKTAAK